MRHQAERGDSCHLQHSANLACVLVAIVRADGVVLSVDIHLDHPLLQFFMAILNTMFNVDFHWHDSLLSFGFQCHGLTALFKQLFRLPGGLPLVAAGLCMMHAVSRCH